MLRLISSFRIAAAVALLGILTAGTLVLAANTSAIGSPVLVTVGSTPGTIETDGTLDLQFDAGNFTNGWVRAAVLQPDGKLLIGGSFSQVHGVKRLDIARLNVDGTLDMSFDPGDVTASLEVEGMTLQPDGKIIVFTVAPLSTLAISGLPEDAGRLTRLNNDGSRDNTFGPSHSISLDGIDDGSGNAINPGMVHSALVQPDGKIVAVGRFFRIITAPGTSVARSGVARFNSAGSLDTSFDPGAGLYYSLKLPGNSTISRGIHVVRQNQGTNNGKIIIQGWFDEFDYHPVNGLVRLNPDGSFDKTFTPGAGANMFYLSSLFAQSDDQLVVFGTFTSFSGVACNGIVRLNSSGVVDSGFSTAAFQDYGESAGVAAVAQQPNGKLIVAGRFHQLGNATANNVVRLETNGERDASFGGAGAGPSGFEVSEVLVRPSDGKIFLGGYFSIYADAPRNNMAWANSDGSMDSTFAGLSGATDYNPGINVLGTQTDGKILAGGFFSSFNGVSSYNLVRLNPDSTTDPSFHATLGIAGSVRSLLIQPDGKILIGGYFQAVDSIARGRVARLNSDGTLDSSFDPGTGADSIVYALAQDLAGNIYVGGVFRSFNGVPQSGVVKLNPNGVLDATFNASVGANVVYAIAPPDGAGRIVIGGSMSYKVARLNGTTGERDIGFNNGPSSGFDGVIRALRFAPDGRYYIGGTFSRFNGTLRSRVARLNNDGSLDANFVGPTLSGSVYALALQNGKILVGGDFAGASGPVIRLIGDGALDSSFATGASFGISPPGTYTASSPAISALTIQVDGKLLVGGTFNQYNGTSRSCLARLTGPSIPTPTPSILGNISTRGRVETGDNVLIGGFIVFGTQPKKVIVRAIGPSLPLAGALVDPVLELRDPVGALIASNDNWRSDQEAEIFATGIPPFSDLESAIVATLPAYGSAYTAIVRGVNNGTGIGVVEAYDLDQTVDSKQANISTRGLVQTGDDVLIAGTIVLDEAAQRVIVRALGPSISVPGKLANPALELRDGNGALLRSNDNWRSDQEAEIIATTIPPSDDLESAIVETLPANGAAYTATVRGVGGTTGIAVVEIYALH